jgi:hypothetical protein
MASFPSCERRGRTMAPAVSLCGVKRGIDGLLAQ